MAFKGLMDVGLHGDLTVQIERSPHHVVLKPDSLVAMSSPNGSIDIGLLAAHERPLSQKLTVVAVEGDVKTLSAGLIESESYIEEIGVLSLPMPTAIETAATILEQLVKVGMPPDAILQRLSRFLPVAAPG